MDAEVTPFDYTLIPEGGVLCTDILGLFDHEATLEFEGSGQASITVIGTEEPGGLSLELTFPVWVR